MRLFRMLVALGCLAMGIVVGALNPQLVVVDLGFSRATASLGVALLLALLVGVLVGGLAVTTSVVLPLRQRLRRVAQDRVAPTDGP